MAVGLRVDEAHGLVEEATELCHRLGFGGELQLLAEVLRLHVRT